MELTIPQGSSRPAVELVLAADPAAELGPAVAAAVHRQHIVGHKLRSLVSRREHRSLKQMIG